MKHSESEPRTATSLTFSKPMLDAVDFGSSHGVAMIPLSLCICFQSISSWNVKLEEDHARSWMPIGDPTS